MTKITFPACSPDVGFALVGAPTFGLAPTQWRAGALTHCHAATGDRDDTPERSRGKWHQLGVLGIPVQSLGIGILQGLR